MSLPHLHLLLNHWPIIGTFMALGLFLAALAGKSEDLKQTSFVVFVLIALLAIPVFTSGSAAAEVMKYEEDVSMALIAAHEGAALLALVLMQVTGGCAWVGLWQTRHRPHLAEWVIPAVLLSSVATVALVTITGNTGGAIRHPEILSGDQTTSALGAIGARLLASTEYVVTGSSRHVWPILETLHFLGLTLLLSTIGIVNLRILGFFKELPVASLQRFSPWGIAGLGINVVTGMLFFVGMPEFYAFNLGFHLKVLAVALAGATLLVVNCTGAFRNCERIAAGEDASGLAKLLAAGSLALWVGVLLAGRYMPFFEESLRP